MCGIAGVLSFSPLTTGVLEKMIGSLHHRGPDSDGVWYGDNIYLGHSRLAIQDLSEAGHQPITSPCSRYVMVFNGEIYNHKSIRKDLESYSIDWQGDSDSETLIVAISIWGVPNTLQKLIGMFAFAVWDKYESRLFLARDRMGEKPLYWGWVGNTLVFASELKAIKEYPEFKPVINKKSLSLYMKYAYVPAPFCIYEGINKLLQGNFLSFTLSSNGVDLTASESYWNLNSIAQSAINNPFEGSEKEAIDLVDYQLGESISDQMLADVPLGAFLSGGIDSSTVVSKMQDLSSKPVKTYTIGFEEKGYNEAEHAKKVANYLGTDHTELYVTADDSLSVIPNLSRIYCEPFADSSQIPTFLVSKLAKEDLTVALSGDGGDELFGGYNRYLAAKKIWGPIKKYPQLARRIVASSFKSMSEQKINNLHEKCLPLLPKKFHISMPGEKLHKLASVLTINTEKNFYQYLIQMSSDSSLIIKSEAESLLNFDNWLDLDCIENSMMLADANGYLADDILVKVDRAAMANSLETRVPMLDHRFVELAWKMPLNFKIRDGKGKWLLREVLYRRVPKDLIERPKVGFGLPLAEWLRLPLRDWAESLLDPTRLNSEGYFNVDYVRYIWSEHLSRKQNNQYVLWNILMFQSWLDSNS